jgi:diguanylate cyclase (GGDEF) domain
MGTNSSVITRGSGNVLLKPACHGVPTRERVLEFRVDILTGLMIWAAEAITLAVLLWSRWFAERKNYCLTWSCGFALHGLGVALVAARGHIPDFMSIELANAIILAGVGGWIAGLLQFDGRRVEGYVAVPALIWIAGMFLTPVRETFAYRVVLANMASATGYLIISGLLLKHAGTSRSTRRILAALIGAQAVCSFLVAGSTLLAQYTSFQTAHIAGWLFVPTAICFMASVMFAGKLLAERTEQKLKILAKTDALTGVLNRRGLIDEFHALRAHVDPSKPIIAFLQFDLDFFKQINDRFGHQAGDAVLVAFAEIGQTSLRGRGSFGRMGGEEFASILRVKDMVEAASIAEAVRLTIKRQTVLIGEHELKGTVSAGIALAVAETANLDLLLSAADRALYTAKNCGRDRSAIADGADISIVPSADRRGEAEEPGDLRVSQQVVALRRIAAIGQP